MEKWTILSEKPVFFGFLGDFRHFCHFRHTVTKVFRHVSHDVTKVQK